MKLLFENWRKFLKEEEAVEKLYKALGEDQQKIFKTLTVEQQLGLAMEWSQDGMPGGLLMEGIEVDFEVGDVVLGGKYKNKRMVVKEIGKDELGQPTVNGKPMLKFRIEKHLPDNKKSKKTLDAEKEKLDEQESGLPPGFQGFDVGEPDEPIGSTAGMREIERNFGTYASESKASRYLKPAGLAFLKRYGDGRESIQIYEKGNVLGWAVELSKVTDANTANNIGQKIKKNLWGKRSPKLTSQQWHLHDLPMWVAYDEGAERIEAPKPPPPRQGTLFENWRKFLNEGMKQPSDLPDGVQIRIEDMGGGDIVFKLVDEETGEEMRKDWDKMRDKWGMLYGFVYIRPYGKDNKGFDCMGAFEVSSTGAQSGWGPMLYDLAMEYATKNGGGLVSDRHGVSEDAYFVWKRYMDERDDIEKVQLDDLINSLTPEDADNCTQLASIKWAEKSGGKWNWKPTSMLYRKNNTKIFDKLKSRGKLYDESSL